MTHLTATILMLLDLMGGSSTGDSMESPSAAHSHVTPPSGEGECHVDTELPTLVSFVNYWEDRWNYYGLEGRAASRLSYRPSILSPEEIEESSVDTHDNVTTGISISSSRPVVTGEDEFHSFHPRIMITLHDIDCETTYWVRISKAFIEGQLSRDPRESGSQEPELSGRYFGEGLEWHVPFYTLQQLHHGYYNHPTPFDMHDCEGDVSAIIPLSDRYRCGMCGPGGHMVITELEIHAALPGCVRELVGRIPVDRYAATECVCG